MKSKRTVARERQERKRKIGHLFAMRNELVSAIRRSVDPNVHRIDRKKAEKSIPYFEDQIAKTEPLVKALQS
jgi:hypothetical protein